MGNGLDLRSPIVQENLNHIFAVIQATISVVQLIVHHLNVDIQYRAFSGSIVEASLRCTKTINESLESKPAKGVLAYPDIFYFSVSNMGHEKNKCVAMLLFGPRPSNSQKSFNPSFWQFKRPYATRNDVLYQCIARL